jgi:hypothetical protein
VLWFVVWLNCLLLLLLLQVILTVRDPASWYDSVKETVWAICRVRDSYRTSFGKFVTTKVTSKSNSVQIGQKENLTVFLLEQQHRGQ